MGTLDVAPCEFFRSLLARSIHQESPRWPLVALGIVVAFMLECRSGRFAIPSYRTMSFDESLRSMPLFDLKQMFFCLKPTGEACQLAV